MERGEGSAEPRRVELGEYEYNSSGLEIAHTFADSADRIIESLLADDTETNMPKTHNQVPYRTVDGVIIERSTWSSPHKGLKPTTRFIRDSIYVYDLPVEDSSFQRVEIKRGNVEHRALDPNGRKIIPTHRILRFYEKNMDIDPAAEFYFPQDTASESYLALLSSGRPIDIAMADPDMSFTHQDIELRAPGLISNIVRSLRAIEHACSLEMQRDSSIASYVPEIEKSLAAKTDPYLKKATLFGKLVDRAFKQLKR
jgi:hypothetical protein